MSKHRLCALLVQLAIFAISPASFAVDPSNANELKISLKEAIDRAIAGNPEIKQIESKLKAARATEKLGLSPFLPELSLETGHEIHRSASEDISAGFLYGVGRINLYNGGRDRQELRIQGAEREKSEVELKFAKLKVARLATKSYLDLLYLQESLKTKNEGIELNSAQMQIAKRKALGGLTSNADVLEFEFQDNSLRTEITLLEHERNLAARNLRVAIGEEPAGAVTLLGTLESQKPVVVELKSSSLASSAPEQEESKILAERDLDISRLKYSSALGAWLPRANLIGQYGDLRFAEPDVRDIPAWSVQLRVTIPLFTGIETLQGRQAEMARVTESESRLRKSQLDLLNQRAHQEEKLKVIDKLIELQKVNVLRAEKYYRATLDEYRRGVKNAPDMSGATERWLEARLRSHALIRDRMLSDLGMLDSTGLPIP